MRLQQTIDIYCSPVFGSGMGNAHLDVIPSFHPPSLKNPKRIPVDDQREKSNKFLDKMKRDSKATMKRRLAITKQTSSFPPQGVNTFVTPILW